MLAGRKRSAQLTGLVRTMIEQRELIWVLVARDFAGHYRQSLLGLGWAVVQPIALTAFFVLVRVVLKGAGAADTLALYVAMLPWTFFANGVLLGSASCLLNRDLLKKIYFPREVFVISAVLTRLVDFAVAGVILVPLLVWFGAPITLNLLWVPLLLVIEMALIFGLCFLAAPAAVYKRDIVVGLPFLIQFVLFLSPVIFRMDEISRWSPRAARLLLFNPMTGVIEGFRNAIIHGAAPDAASLGVAAGVSVALLAVGYFVFKRLEMRFADVV